LPIVGESLYVTKQARIGLLRLQLEEARAEVEELCDVIDDLRAENDALIDILDDERRTNANLAKLSAKLMLSKLGIK
jgi:hypothetical protein